MKDQKAKVTIYTKDYCPYCVHAKSFFKEHGISYNEVKLEENEAEIRKLQQDLSWRTLPMIMINDQMIGGYTDMKSLHASGELMKRINS